MINLLDEDVDFTFELNGLALKNAGLVILIGFVLSLIIGLWLITFSGKRKNGENGLSCWGWIGVYLISCIPIVSLVMMFIWAFGEKTRDDFTFRCWARLNLISSLLI